MPDRPESSLSAPAIADNSASHAMLNEVQQHKSYLQTGVDGVLDFTIGSNSAVGKEISRYAPTFLQTAASSHRGAAPWLPASPWALQMILALPNLLRIAFVAAP